MTTREPTEAIRTREALDLADDALWAVQRLIELVGERDRRLAIEVVGILGRERTERVAARLRRENPAPG